jgi:hypothetical protein
MQVTIDHSEKAKGLFSRRTHHVVATRVEFTDHERAALMRFGDAVLVGRDPPSTATSRRGADPSDFGPGQFDLKISDLVKGTDRTSFESPATARRYADAVKEALAKLKANIELFVHRSAALLVWFGADAIVVL